jgi:ABC-type lipoprotein export system ATPase subunit
MDPVADTPTLGHLSRCGIDGLFGQSEIVIETASTGPTLLHGRNGSGKSTFLRILDDLAHARWYSLMERPFKAVDLRFASGARLAVSKTAEQIAVVFNDDVWQVSVDQLRTYQRRAIKRRRYMAEQGRYVHAMQSELFTGELQDQHPWIAAIPELWPVLFIEDQRLIFRPRGSQQAQPSSNEIQAAVSRFPEQLYDDMQRALSTYAAHSQDLDRRFPVKIAAVVEQEEGGGTSSDADVQELRDLFNRVRDERRALERVGLLRREEDADYFDSSRLETERVRPVIRAFVEDTLKKFAVLKELQERLERFTSFLNQHYRGKQVVTSRDDGFVILLNDGTPLKPSQLSSGEQQVLVLAFEVLFGSKPGTLILIDEPELSLHVVWQSTLIDDLVSMGSVRDVTFMLATHSPTLIGDRVELIRALEPTPHAQIDTESTRSLLSANTFSDSGDDQDPDDDDDDEDLAGRDLEF